MAKKIRTQKPPAPHITPLQAWILAILPLALGLILHAMNEEVYSLMYTTPLGWMILILIFLMEAVGLFLMLKTVKVKI